MKRSLLQSKTNSILALAFSLSFSGHAAWGETLSFMKGMIRNPLIVGAISPTSKKAAKELASKLIPLCKNKNKIEILECGGGTGQITHAIIDVLENGSSEYKLDVVERDPKYAEILTKMFKDNPKVTILCQDLTTWKPTKKYDAIVSTVPFNALQQDQIESILSLYENLLHPNSTISYIELRWIPSIVKLFTWGKARREFLKKLKTVKKFRERFSHSKVPVPNLPPAFIHHIKIDKELQA
jgi:phospholipid N-methyltransferase